MTRSLLLLPVAALAFSCGSTQSAHMDPATGRAMNAEPSHMMTIASHQEDDFRALEVAADYRTTLTLMNREPFMSPTHGHRWVNVYVNRIGLDAYQHDQDLPVGSIVVKESFEDAGGHPDLNTPGPVFVMERRAAGYAPDRADWWYAIHWAHPAGPRARMSNGQPLAPLYWRGRSERVQYCEDCHNAFDNRMGGVPNDVRTWMTAAPSASPAP